MNKKIIIVCLVFVVTVMCFAGCSNKLPEPAQRMVDFFRQDETTVLREYEYDGKTVIYNVDYTPAISNDFENDFALTMTVNGLAIIADELCGQIDKNVYIYVFAPGESDYLYEISVKK